MAASRRTPVLPSRPVAGVRWPCWSWRSLAWESVSPPLEPPRMASPPRPGMAGGGGHQVRRQEPRESLMHPTSEPEGLSRPAAQVRVDTRTPGGLVGARTVVAVVPCVDGRRRPTHPGARARVPSRRIAQPDRRPVGHRRHLRARDPVPHAGVRGRGCQRVRRQRRSGRTCCWGSVGWWCCAEGSGC